MGRETITGMGLVVAVVTATVVAVAVPTTDLVRYPLSRLAVVEVVAILHASGDTDTLSG